MYSEFEVKRQISAIEDGSHSSLRKARMLLLLSRKIRKFTSQLDHGSHILEEEDDEAAARLQSTRSNMKRLHDEARLAAFRALKSEPDGMGFAVVPQPAAWSRSSEAAEVAISLS